MICISCSWGMLGTLSKDHNENTMPTRVKMIPFCKDPYPKKIHFIWVAMYKRTNWGLYFYISNLNRDRHFRWSSKPCEGLAICSEKGVPSFLSYSLDGFGNRTHDLPLCSFSFWILSYILYSSLEIFWRSFMESFIFIFNWSSKQTKTKILNVHFIQINTTRNHVSDELRLKFNDSKGTANKWIWSAKITLGKKYKPESKCFLCI